ncbi:hypothetical protein PENTCL1PPCAC_2370 [Pristionchus entomophagus]|uniref:Uncharacterized protein n=1 Tax=Pristionchus entomophagus TaxID=358040 RepID=A0AAV5SBH9_9BILA|nr:hypothetical protein PENTCL1PPCAC_2370 [Pristionchus entomophagus]
MADDSFDFEQDFDENASTKVIVSKDDEWESYREGLRQFSQRSQGGAPPPEDEGEEIESRSDFERSLKEEHGVGLRRGEDGKEYFYLSRHMNHLSFVNHLNAVLSHGKDDKFMEEFRNSIDGRLILFLYFKPMKSRHGEQDTLWKALLLCRETQNKAFELLMEEMQKLGKDHTSESRELALVAVSHIRFLDCVFDSKIIFESVFDRDFHKWKPCVRDELIQAIPEIFGDIVSQNDAAMSLVTLIESPVEEEPNEFQISILNSLKLLTTGKEEATEIRTKLIKRMNKMEARAAIEIVNMVMDGLDTNDLATLHEILTLFSLHFKLSFQRTLGTKNKKTVDDVTIGIGAKIGRFVQLSGNKCWKVIGPFFRSLTSETERSENGEEENQQIREWRIFDAILCISLMSIEGCPPSITAALKSQITDDSREEGFLEEKFSKIFEMNKFCLLHFPSFLRLSRYLLWSPLDSLNHFSTFIYYSLFRSLEKKRKETLSSMQSHMDKSEREASSVLNCISLIIKKEYGIIKDHVNLIHNAFLSLLSSLSLTCARMMLTVVISICTKDPSQEALKTDVEETSRRLLSSLSIRDQSLGIVCMVMQLKSSLDDENGSNGEEVIHSLLDTLGSATKGSSILRWTLYDEMRLMMQKSSKWKKSDTFLTWAEALEDSFKADFFHERTDRNTHSKTLESDKYVNEECDQWLQVSHDRLVELVPLFGLLKELSVLKCRWKNDEETQEAVNHSFDQFMYTFEANITMCGASAVWNTEKDELLVNSTIFFHLIQWIRTLLNSFCEKEESPLSDDSPLSKLKMKKFSLLFDMEKALQHTIKQLGEVRVPSSIVKDLTLVIYDENAKKPTKKRPATTKEGKKGRKKKKKKGDEEEEVEEEVIVEEERVEEVERMEEDDGEQEGKNGIIDEKRKRLPSSSLNTVFIPFKMGTVVQLMQLQKEKRLGSLHLVDDLLRIVKVALPKKEKKAVPWNTRPSPLDTPSIEYHGDGASIWKYTISSISPIINLFYTSFNYFKELQNSQAIRDSSHDVTNSMSSMLNKSLSLLIEIFTSKDVVNSTEDETGKRANKRRLLMEIVEKAFLKATSSEHESSQSNDAETAVLRFLKDVAESISSIDCAVAVMECCYSIEGRDEEDDKWLGQWCLKYLAREWTIEDGKVQKGSLFKTSVKRLFELYLSYRILEERSVAILWVLTEQLTFLVGDSDKRKSKMDTVSTPIDDFIPQEIIGQKFMTINKETFPVVYRVLFSTLNSTIQSLITTRCNMTIDEQLTIWNKCGSAFCLFSLLLRIPTLRSNGLLVTAAKEGRRFLLLFSKPTGFMSLLEDETTFSQIAEKVLGAIRTMQTGNRTLQNITVYAKANRNEALLKMIPDLRAAGEGWMRSIHSALAFLGCESAFEIGHLKGRNIDGEVINDEEEREEERYDGGEEEGDEEEEIEEERDNSRDRTRDEYEERGGSPAV